MKKFLIAITILTAGAANAEYIIPQWSDFCPKEYLDYQMPQEPQKGFWKSVGYLATYDKTGEYWFDRRKTFEKGFRKCAAIEDGFNRRFCYTDLRSSELAKNKLIGIKDAPQTKILDGRQPDITTIPMQFEILE